MDKRVPINQKQCAAQAAEKTTMSCRRVGRFVAMALLLSSVANFGIAQQPRDPQDRLVDFARDVYPILRRSCLECHGAEKQKGGLRLDRRADALGSDAIKVSEPDDSELLRRIKLPRGHDDVMPALGDPLPKRQISIIRRWIKQGAEWPDEFAAGPHWSYIEPQKPHVPRLPDSRWAQSPIDEFVLRRLNAEGLKPSPPASAEKLVRRVYLDLIGLPPSPHDVDKFLADSSDDRFENIVDELLNRPQFGERWARLWLDLARYADSHGFQRDNLRDIWAYRDWVIQALNADMPFDQFTIEQIAGDLLPNATESQKIATGFHRCAPTNVEAGSLPEETRIEQVIDRVNTTGAVWLGTTLECCQCHDHKYDPFPMKDYYRLLAFYNSTEMEADRANPKTPSSIQFKGPSMPLSNRERDSRRSDLQNQLTDLKKDYKAAQKELSSSLETWLAQFADDQSRPQTHLLKVTEFESEGSTDRFKRLDDGSLLLVGGDPPDTDVYQVRTHTSLNDVRAFRLDALRDESLPGGGPGRGDPERRNFVLNKFSVHVEKRGATSSASTERTATGKLEFSTARASFSQTKWDVTGALEGSANSGWAIAPQFDKSHWATFVLKDPLDVPDSAELVFTLTQSWGKSRTIGRFKISAITGNVDGETIPDDVVALAAKPIKAWSKKERTRLLAYRETKDTGIGQLKQQIAGIEKQLKKVAPDTTLVMVELKTPRKSTIFERGDYRKPGEMVQPGTPTNFPALSSQTGNRLALARWLVSTQNPLVARVTVNRWWAELFGHGIVTTLEDFGVKGEPPTHPDLLDWLAVEFVENGWSMKKTLKTILLSATYQQSSRVTSELLSLDDRNRLLARGPRFRMSAEMIRDNALAISQLLDLKQFGPPIRPVQPDGIWSKVGGTTYQYKTSPGSEKHRRGIYVVLKRGSPYPSFVNFDATSRLACTVKRSRTNTPLQALTLLNDPVYVEAAKSLAHRVVTETEESSLDAQLDYAFRLCTARRPTSKERAILRNLFMTQIKSYQTNSSSSEQPTPELDGWYSVATVLLSMHETITKD